MLSLGQNVGKVHTAQGGGAAVLLRTVAHEIQPLQVCDYTPRQKRRLKDPMLTANIETNVGLL
eukprot:scaffold68465_cov18-Tisochrysis_lutea.AAC.3